MKERWNCLFFFFFNNSTTKLLAESEKVIWLDRDLDFLYLFMLLFVSVWEAFAAPVFGVSSCRSAHYEGHAALPHPPAIVTWTHIKPQPPLKCCELQRRGHRNPNIRRHLAVKSGEQFEVRHYNEQWPHQTSSGEHMEDLPRCQHNSWFSECNLNPYITVT